MMKSIHGLKGADTCLFLNFPGSIELTGALGNGHAYTFELIVDEIGRTSRLIGIYNDEYIKENGKWVFKSRKFQKLHEIGMVDFDSIPIPKDALKKSS